MPLDLVIFCTVVFLGLAAIPIFAVRLMSVAKREFALAQIAADAEMITPADVSGFSEGEVAAALAVARPQFQVLDALGEGWSVADEARKRAMSSLINQLIRRRTELIAGYADTLREGPAGF